MNNLAFKTCDICNEKFPGLQLHNLTTQCTRCYKDKQDIKLYSKENNMDPGILPTVLQVNVHIINLPQDVQYVAQTLPRLPSTLDIIIFRQIDNAKKHKDFTVRRSHVLNALQWLINNNIYYRDITIDLNVISNLPGNDTILFSFPTVTKLIDNTEPNSDELDSCQDILSGTFVPMKFHQSTEKK